VSAAKRNVKRYFLNQALMETKVDEYLEIVNGLPEISISKAEQDSLTYNTAFMKFSEGDYEVANTTFNSWNVDLGYSWWFAPGSQISVLYRNSLLSEFDSSGLDYFENLKRMFENSPQNVFSVKRIEL